MQITSPSVGIKSVAGRTPLPFNNGSTVDLPLCGGAQTVTLTLPQEFYTGAPSVPITDYAWYVPAPFTVAGVPLANGFSPARYLSGRSLTINVPAGQFNAEVRVAMYVRDCNENTAYGNAPATLVSFDQRITVRRVLPVVTSITPSRARVTCGDQRPLTLTAAASQAGASSFSWTLPSGWSFAPGTATTGATVSVVPPGGQPAGGGTTFSGTVSAIYTCVSPSYATAAASFSIDYSNQVAQPTITVPTATGNPPLFCYGESFTASADGPGGAQFTWSGPPGVTFTPQVSGPGQSVRVDLPYANYGYGDITVSVTAGNATFNCQASVPATQKIVLHRAVLDYATNPVRLQVGSDTGYNNGAPPSDYPGAPSYLPVQCNTRTWLRLYGNLLDYYGNPLTGFHWNVNGQEPANSAGQTTVLVPLGGSQGAQVCLTVLNRCGVDEYYCWQIPTYGDCGGGGGPIDPEPCVECGRQAPTAAYPNPADADLTVPVPAGAHGAVRLLNAQGRPVRQAPVRGSRVVLDVRALPNGLYYLEVPSAGGAPRRQQMQVQH
ncbi:T9SS type A sorting domain-containing protein [Hymenobacter monticola]|uniref:T9SS type A sorting domain-containing protein n=1 Tax=Hymenobacter monticola TaxID=1705399 RepID=A0ABY4B7B1_9BACT|nr:T9SS type A sorting domain-containing protein [Hymenobacter monticola]UOE35062.1 T9SS type A sorting domain-containing protein [Hymenobacter monticola]